MGEKYSDVDTRTLEEGLAEIRKDANNIKTFSIMYLREHRAVLDEAILIAFERPSECTNAKEVLESIPEALLKDEYRKILAYVSKDGKKLAIVPHYLQELYLGIPMEAVRNNPEAFEFVAPNAIGMFPDIRLVARR